MKTIKITPVGNIGNQMFQYMFARRLQRFVPDCRVTGYAMDMWALRSLMDEPLPEEVRKISGGHRHDVAALANYLLATGDRAVDYGGYGQRLEYYGSAREMSKLFVSPEPEDVPVFGDDSLLINVRANEILRAIHGDYLPVPVSFYRRLVSDVRLKPVFMGQIYDDFYSTALRAAFPHATFLTSMGPIRDFETIRRAAHIAISVSSFSWLGAWFSEAKTIHLPALGFMNPTQRPDVDLIPKDDPRYVIHPFPVRFWTGSDDDRRFALEG